MEQRWARIRFWKKLMMGAINIYGGGNLLWWGLLNNTITTSPGAHLTALIKSCNEANVCIKNAAYSLTWCIHTAMGKKAKKEPWSTLQCGLSGSSYALFIHLDTVYRVCWGSLLLVGQLMHDKHANILPHEMDLHHWAKVPRLSVIHY